MFAAVYERHCGTVVRYVARRLGSDAAEDLTAEVFVRAFRGRTKYDPQHDSALPWLLGIASNVISEHRRAERRRLAAVERIARLGFAASLVEGERSSLAPALACALRALPTVDRSTLLLVVWGELSYCEAAAALGVPVGTVRSRVARARERLSVAAGLENCSTQRAEARREGETHA